MNLNFIILQFAWSIESLIGAGGALEGESCAIVRSSASLSVYVWDETFLPSSRACKFIKASALERWLFALELVTTVAVHDNRGKEVRWRSLNSNANCGAKPAERQQVKQIASFPFATTVTELLIGSKWRKKSLKRFRSEHPDRSSFSFN